MINERSQIPLYFLIFGFFTTCKVVRKRKIFCQGIKCELLLFLNKVFMFPNRLTRGKNPKIKKYNGKWTFRFKFQVEYRVIYIFFLYFQNNTFWKMMKFLCWVTIIVKNVSVYSCKFDKYICLVNATNWTRIWTTLPDSSLNVHYSLSLFDIHIFTTCECT